MDGWEGGTLPYSKLMNIDAIMIAHTGIHAAFFFIVFLLVFVMRAD